LSPARRASGRSDEPQALGVVLDALGAERRLAAGLILGNLGRRWHAVVGERLAEESAPAGLEGGVLLVKASSAAWAAQIKFLAKEIREAANRVIEAGAGLSARGQQRVPEPSIREVRVVVEAGPRTQ
jgi:predicted nucleic acid-binding Zn ribbon protein